MASRLWTLSVLMVLFGCSTGDSADTSPPTPLTSTTTSSSVAAASLTTTSTTTSTTTTTAVPEPPPLDVTDPSPNAVVATAVYTFQGVTDPGCTVDVGGKYFADVDADGAWTLDLVLRPGGNTTTLTATDEDGAKTAVPVSLTYAPFVLSSHGLGVASFGDPVDEVVAILTDLLGPPSRDQFWEAPFEVPDEGWDRGDRGPDACHYATTGDICFDYIRFMFWDDVGLGVTFSDLAVNREADPGEEQPWVQVPPSLQGYGYHGGEVDPLAYTTHGLTIGSTVTDLQAPGNLVTFGYDACGGIVEFSITEPDDTNGGRLRGYLDGTDPDAFERSGYLSPEATVRYFQAGAQSSC